MTPRANADARDREPPRRREAASRQPGPRSHPPQRSAGRRYRQPGGPGTGGIAAGGREPRPGRGPAYREARRGSWKRGSGRAAAGETRGGEKAVELHGPPQPGQPRAGLSGPGMPGSRGAGGSFGHADHGSPWLHLAPAASRLPARRVTADRCRGGFGRAGRHRNGASRLRRHGPGRGSGGGGRRYRQQSPPPSLPRPSRPDPQRLDGAARHHRAHGRPVHRLRADVGPRRGVRAHAFLDGRAEWHAVLTLPAGTRFADPLAGLRRRFRTWHEPVPALLDATRPDAVLHHDVNELRTPLPSYAVGRIALLGDAAHAMTPPPRTGRLPGAGGRGHPCRRPQHRAHHPGCARPLRRRAPAAQPSRRAGCSTGRAHGPAALTSTGCHPAEHGDAADTVRASTRMILRHHTWVPQRLDPSGSHPFGSPTDTCWEESS